jgi:hypothetical protein
MMQQLEELHGPVTETVTPEGADSTTIQGLIDVVSADINRHDFSQCLTNWAQCFFFTSAEATATYQSYGFSIHEDTIGEAEGML